MYVQNQGMNIEEQKNVIAGIYSGSGLVTVQNLVLRHGGRIWIDLVAGNGTTVHFTLANKQSH